MNEITITISAQTLNAIGAGLQELPYKVAAPAIREIDGQVKRALEREQQAATGETDQSGGSDGSSGRLEDRADGIDPTPGGESP